METINEKIRKLFEEEGITQTELAKRAELSYCAVRNIINGRVNPSRTSISKLAEALGVERGVIDPEFTDDKQKKLGERIQIAYNKMGITQHEFAEKAGVSYGTISNIINNRHEVRTSTLLKIERALDIASKQIDSEFMPEDMGGRIRILSQSKGIYRKQLAMEVGVSYNTITNIVHNHTKPRVKTVIKIAKVLGVRFEDIASGGSYKIPQGIGEKIQKLCDEKQMSLEDLAQKAGVSYCTIRSIIFYNYTSLREDTIVKIAKALDVEVDDISPKNAIKNPQSVGERLQRICQEKGITRKQLAKKANVAYSTINNIIKNRHTAKESTLMLIAKALEVEIQELGSID